MLSIISNDLTVLHLITITWTEGSIVNNLTPEVRIEIQSNFKIRKLIDSYLIHIVLIISILKLIRTNSTINWIDLQWFPIIVFSKVYSVWLVGVVLRFLDVDHLHCFCDVGVWGDCLGCVTLLAVVGTELVGEAAFLYHWLISWWFVMVWWYGVVLNLSQTRWTD